MTKRKTKGKYNQINENENPTVESFRKQTRFGVKTQIQGRNNLNNCLLCGVSFKRENVIHKVVKSAKGVRLHICGDCANKAYPSAQDYVKPSVRKLAARGV